MKIFLAILCFSVFAVLFAGCGSTTTTPTPENSNTAGGHDMSTHNGTTTDVDRPFKVDFASEPATIQAGAPATLAFTVKDKQGATVRDLPIVHEKPMHLLIVSKDLAEFYHVHPEPSADGSYRIQHTFPNGGEYKLYADFTPKDSAQVVDQIDLKVAGPERPKEPLVADTNYAKTVNGLKVVMKPDGELRAGGEVMLNFQMFDAASGKPVTDLQNYLGELAHFVIISEDMKDFVHAHPMAKGEKMDDMKMDDKKMGGDSGGEHKADGHDHLATEGKPAKPSESEVSAHTSFPRSGLYKLWAQFQRGGQVISVPFIVRIAEGQKVAAKAANVPAGFTQVTVAKDGYSPSSINVKSGEKVSLAFYRADAENCGGEVVFQKQNITKKLPVGETVLVEFTPAKAGEIAFACGMDMLRGKVIVGGM